MSLRPLSATISALLKIVVSFLLLFLLLNFVYVPSCGRFACSYEPSWWSATAQAADGTDCPPNIAGAAASAQWAKDRLEDIEDKPLTAGVYYDEDGTRHVIGSGRDDTSELALKMLRELGAIPPVGRPNAVDHVEIKVAALMRQSGIKKVVLVINNPKGICALNPEGQPQPMSCLILVRKLLPADGTLTVWSPQELAANEDAVKLTGGGS